jgi:UDPglucose--hexose-1-phosphate uridylyltransferase
MAELNLADEPHRRLNLLTGEWILVSPHRAKRPWQGQVEKVLEEKLPSYDPACYLCPGNRRAGGERNPTYENTFVFKNDFSALLPGTAQGEFARNGLLVARGEEGLCRVVCFSPRHDLSLAEMGVPQIRGVIEAWAREYESLGARPAIDYVQIFENKGPLMGCSNPHPHGQIWAQRSIPMEPAKELARMTEYSRPKNSCLLCDYLALERREMERLVFENDDFAVLVPFWAVWPFETLILSKRHLGKLNDLNEDERGSLADIISRITIRYDNLFETSFPYSAGFHPSPTDGGAHPEWHLHMHFYPPLLRSATVKKFMVGYEMLANPQRDLTAELSAERLRTLPETHYKKKGSS